LVSERRRRALVALADLGRADAALLRDGLGRRRAADVERRSEALGLALLGLAEPIDGEASATPAARDPFAGRPVFGIGYAPGGGPGPAWPMLSAAFIVNADQPLDLLYEQALPITLPLVVTSD
jgi:hypothetical protein